MLCTNNRPLPTCCHSVQLSTLATMPVQCNKGTRSHLGLRCSTKEMDPGVCPGHAPRITYTALDGVQTAQSRQAGTLGWVPEPVHYTKYSCWQRSLAVVGPWLARPDESGRVIGASSHGANGRDGCLVLTFGPIGS